MTAADDDCTCGHDHGVSTTRCGGCHWCQQEIHRIPPAEPCCNQVVGVHALWCPNRPSPPEGGPTCL